MCVVVASAAAVSAHADVISDAIDFINMHDYDAAREVLTKAKAKGGAEVYRLLGRLDFLDYDFAAAQANYNQYNRLMQKAKKAVPDEVRADEARVALAEGFLDRVERIAVIDSIEVSRDDFFRAYRLAASAGSLNSSAALPFADRTGADPVLFANEDADFLMWGEAADNGVYSIMEAIRLTDGSWHEPVQTPDVLNQGGNARYPFMMADGTTLYFASDGEGSMGGLDLFVANRDSDDGSYMAPQNMGMPYNSPYDDFMLAIDEQTGAGWWATDRNNPGADQVTVYVFVPSDVRENVDTDSDDLVALARLSDIALTRDADKDYSSLLADIRRIDPTKQKRRADFSIPVGGGRVLRTADDIRTPQGRRLVAQYLNAEREHADRRQQLDGLRRQYHAKPSAALAGQIKNLEKQVEADRTELTQLRSEIVRIEK